tara:strand:+ start:13804 stop:15384 length:1581 start_codon:yes stop_codon:yes gene_type:complete
MQRESSVDLLVAGGGINGVGIARDASGRGLSVMLVEQDDLGAYTSSASTKLIHGGLRYLEQGQFRLVREALQERERLWRLAPHIIRPLTFILPHQRGMRPAWLIRLGLFLYDYLGGRGSFPPSRSIKFRGSPYGAGLKPDLRRGFLYTDCQVQDSRLVILNALDAAERGAIIRTFTRLVKAVPRGKFWQVELKDEDSGADRRVLARALVNATGPWVAHLLKDCMGDNRPRTIRLVKGSHIVVPRLYDGDYAYILQTPDRRVVFVLPFEKTFSLVGTTDVLWQEAPGPARISPEEIRYLCDSVNGYFRHAITPEDVIWSYAGIRPLYDEDPDHGVENPSVITRDYVLDLEGEAAHEGGAARPVLLNVYGGKITTYRKLAEAAVNRLAPHLGCDVPSWTATSPLPGGDMPDADFDAFFADFRHRRPFVPLALAERLCRAYGTRVEEVLGEAVSLEDLGENFGGGLYQAEVDYLVLKEWARRPEDILYRRSKLGLHVPPETLQRLSRYMVALRQSGAFGRYETLLRSGQ